MHFILDSFEMLRNLVFSIHLMSFLETKLFYSLKKKNCVNLLQFRFHSLCNSFFWFFLNFFHPSEDPKCMTTFEIDFSSTEIISVFFFFVWVCVCMCFGYCSSLRIYEIKLLHVFVCVYFRGWWKYLHFIYE